MGDGVISSTDGSTWTVVSTPDATTHIWNAIAMDHTGTYVVVGSDGTQVLRSTDAVTWHLVSTGVLVDPNSTIVLQGVGSNGSLFVISGYEMSTVTGVVTPTQGDVVLTSPDGQTWTQRSFPNQGFALYNTGLTNNVAWNGTTFVTGGGDGLYTSSDGITWTANDLSTVLPVTSTAWIFDRIQFENGQFVAAGVDAVAGASGGERIAVFTSSDGVHWTNQDLAPLPSSFYGMSALSFSAGQYVAAGSQGVYSSSDASTWTLQHSGTQTTLADCIIQGGGKYVVPGEGGTLTSSDGSTWPVTPSTPLPRNGTQTGSGCGAYGAGVYVTIYSGHSLFWSSDAANWTIASPSSPAVFYQSVVWNGSEFLAVGSDTGSAASIATSPDGKNWTSATLSGLPVSSVKFGPQGGLIYANGHFVAWGSSSGGPFIATSTNGSVWTVSTITSLPSGAAIFSVAYGGGTYMALANTTGGTSLVFTSADGLNWSSITGDLPSESWIDLIWGNDEFLAVGVDPATGQGVAAQGNAAGTSWQSTLLQDSVQLSDVIWDGTRYIAVSFYDILTLSPPVSSGGGGGGGGGGYGGGGGGGAFDILALSLLSGLAIRRRERWMKG